MAKAQRDKSVGTPATVVLTKAGITFTSHTYDHDPTATSYGEEAAEALGLSPAQVFKTLLADIDGTLVVAVVPVTGKVDLKALAAAVGGKRGAMADPTVAERTTGYVRGGISPIGQRKKLRTVIDRSASTLEVMYVSGGRRGFDIGLAPADLISLTEATTAVIATPTT